jgi:hydrogenase expression/formation protein HypE
VMEHGEGGMLTHELIKDVFARHLGAPEEGLEDSTVLPGNGMIAVTTDAFTVTPYRFRGGDIGKLAVCGTYNDLAVRGAHPKYMTVSFILEEGLEMAELELVVQSLAREARFAGMQVVAGDTKVVARGQADKLFISAAGIGFIYQTAPLGTKKVQPGDAIIVTGDLGRHGAAILAERLGIVLPDGFGSDCASLTFLPEIAAIQGVHCMRDLTRGGLATCLCEIAEAAGASMEIEEADVPVDNVTRGVCDLLGVDPLYLPCEGRAVLFCNSDARKKTIQLMSRMGQTCAIIGTVLLGGNSVRMATKYRGTRRLSMLVGAELPRMC